MNKKLGFLVINVIILSVFAIAGTSVMESRAAPMAAWTFSGNVYEGAIGEVARPLQGVTVSLYGYPYAYPYPGDPGAGAIFLRSTVTAADGSYSLVLNDDENWYYFALLRVSTIDGYTQVGAETADGSVEDVWTIKYALPLDGLDLTGNNFWQQAPLISGAVYEGLVGDETLPLQGANLALYCGMPDPDADILLGETTTTAAGAFELSTYVLQGFCDEYNLYQTAPFSYFSVGAQSTGGTVQNTNWIQYTGPYDSKVWNGNKFWDGTLRQYLPWLAK